MAKIAIGIDIGGTGIKGALVDVKNGEMIGDRIRVETPAGGSTDDIIATVKDLIKRIPHAEKDTPIGICFPAVVQHVLPSQQQTSQRSGLDLMPTVHLQKHWDVKYIWLTMQMQPGLQR